MTVLLVMRHAKSSWKNSTLEDHDRPLKKRGRKAAPRMGRLLADEALVPELVLTSTALRALETARAVTEACGYEGPVHALRELYLGGPAGYVAALQRLGGNAGRVLVVGHNPDLEDLVEGLCGTPIELPTAALASIRLPIEGWAGLALDGRGTLARCWAPRDLE